MIFKRFKIAEKNAREACMRNKELEKRLCLGMVDPSGEVMKMFTKTMTAAVVDEIKQKNA